MLDTELLIANVTCERCAQRLEAALLGVAGVIAVAVDWHTGWAHVRHDHLCRQAKLSRAVSTASAGTRHRYRVLEAHESHAHSDGCVCASNARRRPG